MKKIDVVAALITGEITALYFLIAIREIIPDSIAWSLPILFPVLSVIGIWFAYFLGKRFLVIIQIAKYFLTGVLATIIDLTILGLLILISGIAGGWAYSGFKGISFIAATFAKYLGNKFWTFEKSETKQATTEVGQFFLVTIVGLLINVAAASIVVIVIGPQFDLSAKTWGNIGGIIAAFVSFTWNFIGYKFIVFKK